VELLNREYLQVASVKVSRAYHHASGFGRATSNGGCSHEWVFTTDREIQSGRPTDESRGNSSVIKRFQRIGDYLEVGVASFATFLIGSIVSLVWNLFAFILILAMWRMLTLRMVSCRLVILYLFGVAVVSAALSWLEWADGRTEFISALVWSVVALYSGLSWVHSRSNHL
jgi:hypothetical protein